MANYFTRRKITRAWQHLRDAAFVNYNDARDIMVLTEAHFVPTLEELASRWNNEGRRVTWVIYPKQKRVEQELKGETCYIARRNFGMLPNKRTTTAIKSITADVLIDLSAGRCLALHYLAAESDARMKIGVADATQQEPPYDLTIRCNDLLDTKKLIEEILFYWAKVGEKR